jgi:hypothetical protein
MSWEEQRRINLEVDRRLREILRMLGKMPVRFSQPRGDDWFYAEITDHADLTTNRWKYAWREVVRGTSGWATLAGGRSGTTDGDDFALNSIEAYNDGTGIEGNSIDHSTNYPAGFSMQPVRGSPVVRMNVGDNSGTPTYDFEYVNAEQGPCV